MIGGYILMKNLFCGLIAGVLLWAFFPDIIRAMHFQELRLPDKLSTVAPIRIICKSVLLS